MKNFEKMGNELITSFGMENKAVISYWKAFEKNHKIICKIIYKYLTK